MQVLDIGIKGERPATSIEPQLLQHAKVFTIDADRYGESLEELGVPAAIVDTLRLDFEYGDYLPSALNASFHNDENRISVKFAGRPLSDSERTRSDLAEVPTLWQGASPSLAPKINNYLARISHIASENWLRTPDANVRISSKKDWDIVGVKNRAWIARLSLAGSVAGTAITEVASKAPPVAGGLVGTGVGIFAGTVVGGSLLVRRNNDKTHPYKVSLEAMQDRAEKFAKTQRAVDLFKDIVQVEFVQ